MEDLYRKIIKPPNRIHISIIELESGTKIFYKDTTINGILGRCKDR